jgi:uncharacterized protein (TIGR02145 family)
MKKFSKNPANLLIMSIMVLAMAFSFSCSFLDEDSKDEGGRGNDIANYRTVTIGAQTWMAENLDHAVKGSRCYDDNSANCAKYGRLYDWETAMTVCPSGWRLPSEEDWDILMNFVQTDNGLTFAYLANKYLKAASGWNDINGQSGNGEDKYGFTALPGGHAYIYGDFHSTSVGMEGTWWTASEFVNSVSYAIKMSYAYERIQTGTYSNSYLLSVRCVKE